MSRHIRLRILLGEDTDYTKSDEKSFERGTRNTRAVLAARQGDEVVDDSRSRISARHEKHDFTEDLCAVRALSV